MFSLTNWLQLMAQTGAGHCHTDYRGKERFLGHALGEGVIENVAHGGWKKGEARFVEPNTRPRQPKKLSALGLTCRVQFPAWLNSPRYSRHPSKNATVSPFSSKRYCP